MGLWTVIIDPTQTGGKEKKKDIFTNFLNAPKYANLSTQFHRLQVNIFGF